MTCQFRKGKGVWGEGGVEGGKGEGVRRTERKERVRERRGVEGGKGEGEGEGEWKGVGVRSRRGEAERARRRGREEE